MPAYIVSDSTPGNPSALETYRRHSAAAVARHGGRFLARGGKIEVLEGDWIPRLVTLVEFPDLEAARTWYRSPEYAKALEIRDQALTRDLILVDGIPGAPSEAPKPRTAPDPAIEALARAYVLDTALKQRDRAALELLLASEFYLTIGGGTQDISRDVWLENAVDKMAYTALEFHGRQARVFGEFVAVDAGFTWIVTRETSEGAHQEYVIKGTVVEMWIKRGDRWQILWRHSTRVSEEPIGVEK